VLAISIVQPALTMFSIAIGVIGALLVAPLLDMSAGSFYRHVTEPVHAGDLLLGLGKSLLFGWIIALVGCHMGMRTRGGATNVGHSATSAVVTSIFLVVVVDGVVTTIWTLARGAA
jgi:phospholipid/cholesterol/gamma-HCH transport system permease protein